MPPGLALFRGLILAQCSVVRQQFGRGNIQHLGNLFPLVFLRHLSGVQDGTIVTAIWVRQITK